MAPRGKTIGAAAVAALAFGLAGAACDGEGGLDPEPAARFEADLQPLNGSTVEGTAAFLVDEAGDRMLATVHAAGLVPGESHAQYVHTSGYCPTADHDTTGDGLVDLAEGRAAFGEALFPLDDDLADPSANGFPADSPIDYQQAVGLFTLNAHVPLDEKPLALETRSVVLRGAFVLDGTVVGPATEGAAYAASLPVACGAVRPAG